MLELVPHFPADIMHPASSNDKHFSSEKRHYEGGSESQVLTKMSSTVTHSSTTSTKKEFVSSTMTSSLSQSGQEPSSVCTKTTVQSSEQSTSENGAPPVVQVNTFNIFVLYLYYAVLFCESYCFPFRLIISNMRDINIR